MNKEHLTIDKFKSLLGIIFGERPFIFTHYLQTVPLPQAIRQKYPDINTIIFDIDGTLITPYARLHQEDLNRLSEYLKLDFKVLLFSNNLDIERQRFFRDTPFKYAVTDKPKPSRAAFMQVINEYQINPEKTAMIGNFPITDMPLGARLFKLNVLIKSVPPIKKNINSFKKWFLAWIYHVISITVTAIVLIRNRKINKKL
ncbi:hypothetical protein GF376_04825 [Candidatus Peregrinibacteria bacterium]|nr:hypothetical protein [Candidatus Peregrinibacteria bacterium]